MPVSQASVPPEAARVTAWNTVVSYASYAEAQAAVDHLVRKDFPPTELEIVGSWLRSVEQLIGAAWGAAFGLSARWLGAGRQSYSSLHSVVATSYDVIALDGMAGRARSVLAER